MTGKPFRLLLGIAACGLLLAGRCSAGAFEEGYIFSVLSRPDEVFACTEAGLYRASRADKAWHKLPLPSPTPVLGYLADEGAPSPRLVYYVRTFSWSLPADESPVIHVSQDNGQTWTRTDTGRYFAHVFVHPNGRLYADESVRGSATPPFGKDLKSLGFTTDSQGNKLYCWHRVVVSDDLGQTWRDISSGLDPGLSYVVFPDPDHPDLVCLSGAGTFGPPVVTIFQADDARYQWKATPYERWHGGVRRRNLSFNRAGIGLDEQGRNACLDTFFKYPYMRWGNGLEMQPVQIEAEQAAYTFSRQGPMPVSLTARYLFPAPAVKIADHPDEAMFWELSVLPEQGEGMMTLCRVGDLYYSHPDHDAKVKEYLADPGLRLVEMDPGHPYRRTVDLAKLYHFPAPGKYQVQARKACGAFVPGDISFAGQVIEVTITD